MNPRALVIYHFFHPDDVVSSRHLSDLAAGLAEHGWDVTALTSNRICRDPKARLENQEETWRGVRIHRTPRPAFKQSSNLGRLMNSFWLMARWLSFIVRQPAYDVIILGTDPQFGYLILPLIRLFKPKTKLVYWGFDLYPEAIIANEMGLFSKLAKAVRPITRISYRTLDGMVDIGPCMRKLLQAYGHKATEATMTPWALTEPEAPLQPDPKTRKELFGDAKLALLYSGTIGKAHQFENFIALARELKKRGASVAFCFAGHGNRYTELRSMVTELDDNISFAGFADESQLAKRLGAGDIHMLSLRPGWEGVVVPSKFFGSLAAGKPVLYEGSPDSSIKTWIEQHKVGYFIDKDNTNQIADELCRLANNPALLSEKQKNAFNCYQNDFSLRINISRWDDFLRKILGISE
jgi:glycosyltransferase involved in cell wall biosynthesis